MTDRSEFSLEPFTSENEPAPSNVCPALEEKIKALEILIGYWNLVNNSVKTGVVLRDEIAVASLLYQHDLLKRQGNQVWALKSSACQLVNLLIFQDNLFSLLVKLHKKAHQFLHVTSPSVSQNLLGAYNEYIFHAKNKKN